MTATKRGVVEIGVLVPATASISIPRIGIAVSPATLPTGNAHAISATVFYLPTTKNQHQLQNHQHCFRNYSPTYVNRKNNNEKENRQAPIVVNRPMAGSSHSVDQSNGSATWVMLPMNAQPMNSLAMPVAVNSASATMELPSLTTFAAAVLTQRHRKPTLKSKHISTHLSNQTATSKIKSNACSVLPSTPLTTLTTAATTTIDVQFQQQQHRHRSVQNRLPRDQKIVNHCVRHNYQQLPQQQQKKKHSPVNSNVLLHHPKYHQQKERRKQRHLVGHIGTTSFLTLLTLICLETLILSTVSDCAKTFYMHWNTSNSIFRIDNTDHIIDVNKGNLAFEFDQVHIICPVYEPGTYENETEKYIIYNVSKVEYETCRITNADPRVIAICDKPQKLMFFTITFRPFTPQPGGLEFLPGNDYYFISTSSKDDLYRRIGGRCSTNNMKVVFKVCCAPDENNKTLASNQSGGIGSGISGVSSTSGNSQSVGIGVDAGSSTSPDISITIDNAGGHHVANTALSNTGISTGTTNNNVNSPGSGILLKPISGNGAGGTSINSNIELYNRNNGINVIANNIDGLGHRPMGGGVVGSGHHHHRGFDSSGNVVIGGGPGTGSSSGNVGGIILTPNHLGGVINVMSTNGIGIGGYLNVGGSSGNVGQPGIGTGIRINNVPTQQQHHHNTQQYPHYPQYKPSINGNNINSNKMNTNGNSNEEHLYHPKHPNEVVKNEELTYNSAAGNVHDSGKIAITAPTLKILSIIWQWLRSWTAPCRMVSSLCSLQHQKLQNLPSLASCKCPSALLDHHSWQFRHDTRVQVLKDKQNCNCMLIITIVSNLSDVKKNMLREISFCNANMVDFWQLYNLKHIYAHFKNDTGDDYASNVHSHIYTGDDDNGSDNRIKVDCVCNCEVAFRDRAVRRKQQRCRRLREKPHEKCDEHSQQCTVLTGIVECVSSDNKTVKTAASNQNRFYAAEGKINMISLHFNPTVLISLAIVMTTYKYFTEFMFCRGIQRRPAVQNSCHLVPDTITITNSAPSTTVIALSVSHQQPTFKINAVHSAMYVVGKTSCALVR